MNSSCFSVYKKTKRSLTDIAPVFLFVLLLAQPALDVVSHFATEWNFTVATTGVRLLMFVGVMLYGFIVSDRKRFYFVFAGVLCAYWIAHMIACIKTGGGYVSPVSDANNFLRTVHMPLFALVFITFFRHSDDIPGYVQKAFFINMIMMIHFELLSYMTGTQIYTYVYAEKGLMGWASCHNAQSAILAFIVPLILLYVYKKKNAVLFYAASLVCFATLFFVGTKVDYFSIFIISFGMMVLLLISGEKKVFYYAVLFVMALLCLLCYRSSVASSVFDSHTVSMSVKQEYVDSVVQDIVPQHTDENGHQLPAQIDRETYDSLDPGMKKSIYNIYTLYLGPMVQRFGFDRVFEKYDYCLDVSTLTAARQQKRYFAEMAWEDSSFLTRMFGYEYTTLVVDYDIPVQLGGGYTQQYVYDLENDFPSVYYYSGYAGFALYMLFLAYFAALIIVAFITRFKETLTLENGIVGITFALMMGVSQMSGNVLRRPNASIYLSLILAYIYYLTVVREGVRLTDIFHIGKKKAAVK